jgi:hypothetical protein
LEAGSTIVLFMRKVCNSRCISDQEPTFAQALYTDSEERI